MPTLLALTNASSAQGRILCFFLALYAVVVFGYLTATLATFSIDRDAQSDNAELASTKSIEALQAEITGLRTDIQALVSRDPDAATRSITYFSGWIGL